MIRNVKKQPRDMKRSRTLQPAKLPFNHEGKIKISSTKLYNARSHFLIQPLKEILKNITSKRKTTDTLRRGRGWRELSKDIGQYVDTPK